MNLNDEYICDFFVSAEKKRINAVYLDLIQEFDRLCNRSHLTYWVGFGALLGAVRHKGFIPWDDDVDILMPREDFDRLQSMTQEDFGASYPYFMQNYTTDPSCIQTLMRFRRSDTTDIRDHDLSYVKQHPNAPIYNMGINLAIFPLDTLPTSVFIHKLQGHLCYLLRGINYHGHLSSKKMNFSRKICRLLSNVCGPLTFSKWIHAIYRGQKHQMSETLQSFDGMYDEPNRWPASAFQNTAFLPFEDIMIRVPGGYEDILSITYGDYMAFPPIEKRTALHVDYITADIPYTESINILLSSSEGAFAP